MPDFRAAKEYVFGRLKKLPGTLYYHNLGHTKDVLEAVKRLATAEGINGDELLELKTAAIYHDVGFLERYENNEEIAARIAEETLPDFGYSQRQTEVIKDMIMATKLPQQPNNRLEEIICDADVDNLGREDFYIKTEYLRRELSAHGKHSAPKEWLEGNLRFFMSHRYFTKAARELRQEGKSRHFQEMGRLVGKRS